MSSPVYIDVLTEDDFGKRTVTVARIESVSEDQYTIRYLVPTKNAGLFDFEKETSIIDLECIDYFHPNVTTIGYTKTGQFWTRNQDEADTESEYEPETSDSSDDESLGETSEEENIEED